MENQASEIIQEMMSSTEFMLTLGREITEHYFNHNFGSMSKSDLETLLFHLYEDNLTKRRKDAEIELSDKSMSSWESDDYTLSKALGITQSRVRALKERSALKYPQKEELDFRDGILSVIKSAYYCKSDKKMHCFINDVIAQIEIRHYLETKFMFDEFSLNPKVMVLTPKAFFEVCDPNGKFGNIIAENKDLINEDLKLLRLKKNEIDVAISKFAASPTPWNLFSVLISNPAIEERADNLILKICNNIADSKMAESFMKMLGDIFKK